MGTNEGTVGKNPGLSRRGFIVAAAGTATAASLGSLVAAQDAHAGGDHHRHDRLLPRGRIGIQLFTVRDKVNVAQLGFAGTFAELARIGYKEIEFAGYSEGFGQPSKVPELRGLLRQYGLRAIGSHVGLGQFRDNLNQVLDDAEAIGMPYIGTANAPDAVLPASDTTPRNTTEAYKRAAEYFNTFGAAARARGMRFYQHNHAGEFAVDPTTGIRLYDTILAETDPRLVFFELDIFWAYVGQFRFGGGYDGPGFDPIRIVRRQPRRFPLFHVKDGVRSTSANGYDFADVGDGVLPFREFFTAILDTVEDGYHHFIMERDNAPSLLPNPPGSLGSAERSYAAMRSWRPLRRHHH